MRSRAVGHVYRLVLTGVSNTDLRLKVEIKELIGTLVLNIPTPPTDRVWIGFRPTPDLALSAQPIVGERNITYLRITSWIEKKLLLEFQVGRTCVCVVDDVRVLL